VFFGRRNLLSKTKVNSKTESKSQQSSKVLKTFEGCQRPKLIQRLKANHNSETKRDILEKVVKDQS